jgi:ABC-2 type transport system ATP-binding protein
MSPTPTPGALPDATAALFPSHFEHHGLREGLGDFWPLAASVATEHHPTSRPRSRDDPLPMIRLDSVTKRFPTVTALDAVSLEIRAGEFFGLLGPNGAGKSTLMSLVCGYRTPDSGTVYLDGAPFAPANLPLRRKLGLVPQSIALYTDLPAIENLRIFGRLYGLRGADLDARINRALADVQLSDRAREPVKGFSGGMQRRLNLAAAILHEPAVLLCDEPTVGVDPQSRLAIFELIGRLHAAGTTIVYSTHYMEEAQRLCTRLGVIDHGRILALGTVDELLHTLPFEDEINFPLRAATPALRAAAARFGQLRETGDTCTLLPGADFRLSAFFATTEELGLPARTFALKRPNLEDVFIHLTGRTLRDD